MLPFFPVRVYADHLLPEEGDDTQGYFNDFNWAEREQDNTHWVFDDFASDCNQIKDLFLQEICKTKALKFAG